MVDRPTNLQVFGCLMRHPQFLSETDKYNLSPNDFYNRFDKYIFIAISNLYQEGANLIHPIDVENYLSTNDTAQLIFKQQHGIEYLNDAEELSDENNFSYYYKKLKKFNLLTALQQIGISVDKYYIEDSFDSRASKINSQFEELELNDIVDDIKKNITKVAHNFTSEEVSESSNVFNGIEDLINSSLAKEDIGLPLQGDIFNEVCSGARKGTFVIRSGSSGVSKTRQAVGDACYMAFPIRYDNIREEWIQCGSGVKTLFIATEQTIKEIQKMVLAYLTGFNEDRFRYGDFSDTEWKIIQQACWVLEQYQENLYIVRMPDPTIELIKNIVREHVLLYNIEYVFYDYIFICPSLLKEFRGYNLRNDEILLMMSTALKDLAVELNVFMMTSTQVNSNADNNQNIRNEGSIAGSRSIINKADIGAIMSRPTKEELDILQQESGIGYIPNIVTDIYKVRSGRWNQVRIWSDVNLGNLRKKDLFVTDARLNVIEDVGNKYNYIIEFDPEIQLEINNNLLYLKGDNFH